jgi:uncharacterized protein YdbL (DUF1318 family)
MQRFGRLVVILAVWVITITCARITVNIYFPAAEIRDAATQIEKEVRQEEQKPETPAGKPQGFRLWPRTWQVRLALGVPEVAAQQIDINITSPAIRRLIAARKQRYPSLVPLFNKGALGEDNQGLVAIRSLEGLSLQDKARAKALSEQENSDRQQLYEALAEANKIPQNKVHQIATIFAEVNRREALATWWVQEPNGSWRKK